MDRQVIISKLTEMFEGVESEIRRGRESAYVAHAEENLDVWKRKLSGEIERPAGSCKFTFEAAGQYVKFKKNELLRFSYEPTMFHLKADLADQYYADVEKAKADANEEVDAAKLKFIHKISKKIASAIDSRDDLKSVSAKLGCEAGMIKGYLDVECLNGDRFRLELSITRNCRTYPRYVAFYQFPARFVSIEIGGVKHRSKSEKWMKDAFNK